MADELALSLRDMETTVKHPRWKVYKSLDTWRWCVWNTGWVWLVNPLKFDTWQQAIDYVNGKGQS